MPQSRKLKILAFSDMHGSEKHLKALAAKAKKADVIVCAGDFTVFENNILRIMRKLDAIGKPVILVNGNHEDPMLVSEICRKLKNIRFVHRGIHRESKYPDYAFAGHGGEGFDLVSEDFERFVKRASPQLLRLKKEGRKIIFVTHQPPHNTKLDFIWDHDGSKSYTKFIKRFQPVVAICGHLHETQGMRDKIGKTVIINPGPKGKLVVV